MFLTILESPAFGKLQTVIANFKAISVKQTKQNIETESYIWAFDDYASWGTIFWAPVRFRIFYALQLFESKTGH